jgi:hypothetical protein
LMDSVSIVVEALVPDDPAVAPEDIATDRKIH